MSRSKDCIQMLMLLKARGTMNREQLAKSLHCNIRNIIEYKKVLEEAGYRITSRNGKYGGYTLDTSVLLPVLRFDRQESEALLKARRFLKYHEDFLEYPKVESAFDKLQALTPFKNHNQEYYLHADQVIVSPRIKNLLEQFKYAVNECLWMDIIYQGLKENIAGRIRIQPYELLHFKSAYYCLAYSLRAKDFRFFKLSEERLKHCSVNAEHFVRNADFNLNNYIGKQGLIHDESFSLEFILYDEVAKWMMEREMGIHMKKKWLDDKRLHVCMVMEGELQTIAFLLSLGAKCKLLAPTHLKMKMKTILHEMMDMYSL